MGLFSDIAHSVSDFRKAALLSTSEDERGRGPGSALTADPYLWGFGEHLYKEKPTSISYEILRYLCVRDTILAAVIGTRLRQVSTFSRPRTTEEVEKTNQTGFRVKLKIGAGERTASVEKRENELNDFIAHCGRPDIDTYDGSFGTFLRKFCKDRLDFDQPVAELIYDNKGELAQFFAIDGATIRVVDPSKPTIKDAAYVQVYQGKPVASFKAHELMFCPENVSSAIGLNGYSISETEIALKKVQAHLGIDETNARIFQPGSMPKGLITIENADIAEDQMHVLEAKWRTQVATYRGKHKIPFLPIPRGGKLNFVSFPQPTDIEHGNFLDFLVNTITALFGMDPCEINFPNRSGGIAGASPSMIQSSPEATRLTASKDKGLRTLLAYLEDCINWHIIPRIDDSDDFEFAFVGFDRQSDEDRRKQDDEQSRVFKTINEIRESHGLDPREDGDVIRDPTWLQAKQMAEQAAQPDGGEPTGDEEPQEDWGVGEESDEGELF